jgi:hypothetical protein
VDVIHMIRGSDWRCNDGGFRDAEKPILKSESAFYGWRIQV